MPTRKAYIIASGSIAAGASSDPYVCEFNAGGRVVAMAAVNSRGTDVSQALTVVQISVEGERPLFKSGQQGEAPMPLSGISPQNGERMAMNNPVRRGDKWVVTFSLDAASEVTVAPTLILYVDENDDDEPAGACRR